LRVWRDRNGNSGHGQVVLSVKSRANNAVQSRLINGCLLLAAQGLVLALDCECCRLSQRQPVTRWFHEAGGVSQCMPGFAVDGSAVRARPRGAGPRWPSTWAGRFYAPPRPGLQRPLQVERPGALRRHLFRSVSAAATEQHPKVTKDTCHREAVRHHRAVRPGTHLGTRDSLVDPTSHPINYRTVLAGRPASLTRPVPVKRGSAGPLGREPRLCPGAPGTCRALPAASSGAILAAAACHTSTRPRPAPLSGQCKATLWPRQFRRVGVQPPPCPQPLSTGQSGSHFD